MTAEPSPPQPQWLQVNLEQYQVAGPHEPQQLCHKDQRRQGAGQSLLALALASNDNGDKNNAGCQKRTQHLIWAATGSNWPGRITG